MSTPSDSNRAHISFDTASKVLVAIDTGHDVDTERGTNPSPPTIDGYILDRPLGSGATGMTYLAHKHNTEARVALKVLHASLGNATKSSRAWRELDALQQIRVPSVPRLLDYGTAGGSLYIATEFLEGSPLDRLYEHAQPANPAEMRSRIQLLERLARAAHTLHEHGVIHRDLKPSNVIVTPNGPDGKDGEPFIIDLGIALIDSPDLHQTLTIEGSPVGTPAFMAPEQARGIRSEISTRSDIYALGAIGYWLCTGQTPHDLSGVTLHEAIRRVSSDPPREPRSISPKLPKPLAAVLAKACAPKPADRYGSALELAKDLGRWLAREPVLATNPSPWRRLTRLIEEHPIWATTAACVVLLGSTAGLSFGVVRWLNFQPHTVLLDTEHLSWARVISRSGNIVKEWNEGAGTFAAVHASRNPATQSLRYVVLARERGTDPLLQYRLSWYAVDNYDTPARSHAPRVPLFLGEPKPTRAHFATQADVFNDVPGQEIIGVHVAERGSQTAISIYSWDGILLSETWHDGQIDSVRYFADQGLFVCVGVNSEKTWAERGYQPRGDSVYPMVVFAFRPAQGRLDRHLAMETPGAEAPLWCLAFTPPDPIARFRWTRQALLSSPPQYREDCFARVDLVLREHPKLQASWLLRPDGTAEALPADDAYEATAGVPDRESLKLVPFQSIMNRVAEPDSSEKNAP